MKAVDRVRRAWTDPGRVPAYHAREKRLLKQSWPVLAAAVEDLAREGEGYETTRSEVLQGITGSLLAEHVSLLSLARAVCTTEPTVEDRDGYMVCAFCYESAWPNCSFEHKPSCSWLLLRQLVQA